MDDALVQKVIGHMATTVAELKTFNTHMVEQKVTTKDLYDKVDKVNGKVNKITGAGIALGTLWTILTTDL